MTMAQTSIPNLGANMEFDIATFGIKNPTNTTVYYRSTVGQGLFLPQATEYNFVTGKLLVSVNLTAQGSSFGEFIFGYPDIAEVAYPPILNAVENYRGVQPLEVIAPLQATTGTVYSIKQMLSSFGAMPLPAQLTIIASTPQMTAAPALGPTALFKPFPP